MIPQFSLEKQTAALSADLKQAVGEVIDSNIFTNGPKTREFEEKWAAYNSCKYCVAVNNGTAALQLALMALDNYDEIILPPASFIATAEAAAFTKKQLRFVDIDSTCNLDPYRLPENANDRTVLMPVALYGNGAHFDDYIRFANRKGCRAVVGDLAQAHGTTLNGKMLAEYVTIGCFSFYPSKNLGAAGEAGAVVCNNEDLYNKMKMIASHGQSSKYNHRILGFNARISEILAAGLLVKLPYLNSWVERRREIAAYYRKNLTDLALKGDIGFIEDKAAHSYHQFVILTPRRSSLQSFLKEKGIETTIHYPYSIPNTKPFSYVGDECFIASQWAKYCLSLPLYPELLNEELDEVIEKIIEFFK